jgi:DNA polymerase-3 subunit delta'
MSFAQIYGQERAVRMLRSALQTNALAHAYIFGGPPGTGRRKAAETLIQAAYCVSGTGDACGECLECRKVKNRNHPEVRWIEPDGTAIKIDQIRELQQNFAFRSAGGRRKFYVVNEAERMTVQAANSLLKFLEEPHSDVVAILITDNGQALLPTIRSRAQFIPFVPVNREEMSRLLLAEGHPAPLVRAAVHLAAGPDAAREMLRADWFAETRNIMIQLARESQNELSSALATIQNQVVKGEAAEHLPVLLDLWLLWFKDLVHLHLGREDRVVFADQLPLLRAQAKSGAPHGWIGCMEHVMELKKRLRFHANAQLGLEQLAVKVHRLREQ